ncbi:hypothetical protein PMAYCL1PPCAC_00937, partial [Pristionchus mayeri]
TNAIPSLETITNLPASHFPCAPLKETVAIGELTTKAVLARVATNFVVKTGLDGVSGRGIHGWKWIVLSESCEVPEAYCSRAGDNSVGTVSTDHTIMSGHKKHGRRVEVFLRPSPQRRIRTWDWQGPYS